MSKRSEVDKVVSIDRAFESARHDWRERFAISSDGGASDATARRLANAQTPPEFLAMAKSGRFDFTS